MAETNGVVTPEEQRKVFSSRAQHLLKLLLDLDAKRGSKASQPNYADNQGNVWEFDSTTKYSRHSRKLDLINHGEDHDVAVGPFAMRSVAIISTYIVAFAVGSRDSDHFCVTPHLEAHVTNVVTGEAHGVLRHQSDLIGPLAINGIELPTENGPLTDRRNPDLLDSWSQELTGIVETVLAAQ